MDLNELKQEAEEKYCKGCKLRIEQCLWAWRNVNGLNEPNEKNCSCKEVPAYLAGAEPREKRIAELEEDKKSLFQNLLDLEKLYQDEKKENAELKEIIDNNVDKKIYVQLANKAESADVYKDQLTKAIKLIRSLYNYCCSYGATGKATTEAEQFLSEVEK